MLREIHYQYTGGSTEELAKKFSRSMRTPLDEAVDTIIEAAQIKGREKDGSTETNGPDQRIDNDHLQAAFSQVHAAEAGSKLLIGAGFTFLLCPHARHWLANFILEQEEKIHEANQEELLKCLRKKAASNAGTTEFLDSIQFPGYPAKANLKTKAKMADIVDVLLEASQEGESSFYGTMVKSGKSTLFRGFWPLLKTTAYLMDYIKDGCLFAYLLQRFKFVLASCSFLRGLIVFHGVSVVTSGIIVGLAIQDSKTIVNLDGIQNVYIVWLLRLFFFICTPLMPLAKPWGDWTECSQTCRQETETGTKTKTRRLKAQSKGSKDRCPETQTETAVCGNEVCSVDGTWSSWSTIVDCTSMVFFSSFH